MYASDEYSVEGSERNDQSASDAEGSRSSVDTDVVDTEELKRRNAELVKQLKQFQKDKAKLSRDKKAKKENQASTSSSVSLSLTQKPKVFELNASGHIIPSKLHTHLASIKGFVVGSNTIDRDSLASLFTLDAQALIATKYGGYLMASDDTTKETDIFSLPTLDLVQIMLDLFPLNMHKSPLLIVRNYRAFKRRWYRETNQKEKARS